MRNSRKIERAKLVQQAASRSPASGRSILLGTSSVCVYDRPTSFSSRCDVPRQPRLRLVEPVEHFLKLLDAVVAAQIDKQHGHSAARIMPCKYGSMKSVVIGGVSINCTITSSQGIMPGSGCRVVNGYGATSGCGPCQAGQQLALAGVGPADQYGRAGACRGMRTPCAALGALALGLQLLLGAADLLLQLRLQLFGALCFGISRSITSSQCSSSAVVCARRYSSSALRYCGVRLAAMCNRRVGPV